MIGWNLLRLRLNLKSNGKSCPHPIYDPSLYLEEQVHELNIHLKRLKNQEQESRVEKEQQRNKYRIPFAIGCGVVTLA